MGYKTFRECAKALEAEDLLFAVQLNQRLDILPILGVLAAAEGQTELAEAYRNMVQTYSDIILILERNRFNLYKVVEIEEEIQANRSKPSEVCDSEEVAV